MANSKYGQGHKDKYLDTSSKILSTRNAHVPYESFNVSYLGVMTKVKFKKKNRSNVKVKRFNTNRYGISYI